MIKEEQRAKLKDMADRHDEIVKKDAELKMLLGKLSEDIRSFAVNDLKLEGEVSLPKILYVATSPEVLS